MFKPLLYFFFFLFVVGISLRTCSSSSEMEYEEYEEIVTISVVEEESTEEPTEESVMIVDTIVTEAETIPNNEVYNYYVTMPYDITSEIVYYTGMVMSFNKDLHIPNWCAWELRGEETIATAPKGERYVFDSNVDGCAYSDDYKYSGYDRGHMVPQADMRWDEEALRCVSLMTNICPQKHELNNGAWRTLEEKCRKWANIDGSIEIICGPIISDIEEYIGTTKVAVPKSYFKVIISMEVSSPRGIGFIMPNEYVNGGMQVCAVSIDSVENVTGYDFFPNIKDEDYIEAQCYFNLWSNLR